MFGTSNQHFNLCSFVFLITFLSSAALFCNDLTSTDDLNTPCFLAPSNTNPVTLRTSTNSLVLPCHVARSKHSLVEWWYTDNRRGVDTKIYPVYPPARPTVLRFVTSLTPYSKNLNETDIIDASILLPYINVDDSGTYYCIIRSLPVDPIEQMELLVINDELKKSALTYNVELTGARLCQSNPGTLPCFTAMRTSSPTILDAYQTAFLQCVIKAYNRPTNVFWVIGDAIENQLVINHHLTVNHYKGDHLRRVFPRSPYDFSVELTVNRTIPERVYSCVIDGASDTETTIFTYIVRTINLDLPSAVSQNVTETIKREHIHGEHHTLVDATEQPSSSKEEEHFNEEGLFEPELHETSTKI
ncbi:unnamed protein product [Adineta ricciae]|uniref:Ig-like domain-containing protein n=1 Tax=Adineta ricciae TaxID=249248 RepID=A0A814W5K6_ADIRI|nr:unnamed protein product [Adineta ricciae]